MNTKRGFIPVIIGIIVVVILVVGAIIYQNSTKTETHNYATHQTNQIVPAPLPLSDWQTYISESANFQIKYPEGWETAVYGALPGNIIVEFAPKNFKAQTKLAVGPISITEHRFQSKGLNSYLNQFKTSDIKEILINNIPAKEVNGEYFHATFHGIYIELPNSQNFLEIVDNIKNEIGANRLSSEVAASLDNIFDQMLSTFKFTDSQVDTSEWKIYHNDKYGFEIKYPKNYADLSSTKLNDTLLDVGKKNNGSYGNYFILRTLVPTTGCSADLYTSQLIKDGNTQREKILTTDGSAIIWKTWKKLPVPGLANNQVYVSRKKCLQSEPVFEIEFGKSPSVSLDTQTNDTILSTFKFTPK